LSNIETKRQPITVSSIVTSGVLKQAIAAMEKERTDAPRNLALLRRLGNLYRQSGELRQAAEIFGEVSAIDPADQEATYLRDLLGGRSGNRLSSTLPPNFLHSHNYLPDEEYRKLVTTLAPLALAMKPNNLHGRIARWDYVGSLGAVGVWFRQHILEQSAHWCDALRIPSFPPEVRGISFTRYADGQSYPLHNDGQSHQGNLIEVIYFLDFSVAEFRGGELLILDDGNQRLSGWTAIPPTANCMVVFPSTHWHEIAPVRCESRDPLAGRFMLAAYLRTAV